MKREFKIGQPYTVVLAPNVTKTEKAEMLFVGFDRKSGMYSYRSRCGRESVGLIKSAQLHFSLVLKGHNLPIKVYPEDNDTNEQRFNFEANNPDQLRTCIESTCVNLYSWKLRCIFYYRYNNLVSQYSGGVRLFPGIDN
jgi:hypothetical protein